MPGGKLASEPVSLWQSASIEESGGFAGLRRGATIERRGDAYSLSERWALFRKFFTKRKLRKEMATSSRLAGLS